MTTHHPTPSEKKDYRIRNAVVVVLIALFLIETSVLIKEFQGTTAFRDLRAHEYREISIEPWMTFRYVNTVYNIAPTYFQTVLGIGDPKYPDIEIRKFARERNIDPDDLIREIMIVLDRGV